MEAMLSRQGSKIVAPTPGDIVPATEFGVRPHVLWPDITKRVAELETAVAKLSERRS
jgi:hypothetical protein